MPDLSSHFILMESQPISAGEQKVTLVSRALKLQVAGLPVGLVWNRPTAVRVQTAGVGEVTLPVADETRRLQILFLALGIVGSIVISVLLRRR